MGIKPPVLALILLFPLLLHAQQDTSRVHDWKGQPVILLKVEKGRTLYSISKQYGVSQDSILAVNPEVTDGLKAGMILRIPVKKAFEAKKELPGPADGKQKGTTSQKEKKEHAGEEETKKEKEKENGKISCSPLTAQQRQETFHIALLLPFYLPGEEELNPRSRIGIDFYSGAKAALDSLAKQGMTAKIHVFDTQNDTTIVTGMVRGNTLKDMDLIIGPLYSSGFKPVAGFAKKNGIAAVSPFSQQDAILESFPNVSKVTPDRETLLGSLAGFLIKKHPNARFILIKNNNGKDSEMAGTLAQVIKKNPGYASIRFRESAWTGISTLIDSLDAVKENIIFFPSTTETQVIDLVSRLYKHRTGKRITLVGLDEWNTYENIDLDQLNQLNFTFASNTYNDATSEGYRNFCRRFRDEYKTDPGHYALQGFDVTYYYARALFSYGKDFYKCLEQFPVSCGFNSCYSFRQESKGNGYENGFVNILRMEDFGITRLNKQ